MIVVLGYDICDPKMAPAQPYQFHYWDWGARGRLCSRAICGVKDL